MKKLFVLVIIVLASCTREQAVGDGFMVYYPSLTELCPGTPISLNPSWVGGTPTAFSIAAIRHDGKEFQTSCFEVNEKNGTFSISNSDDMPVGSYEVDICCMLGDESHLFNRAVEITMMKSVPDGIVVTPSVLEVKINDIWEGEKDLPIVRIVPDGNSHVQIKRFILANVYKDGELVNSHKSWFTMDEDSGVFSINSGNVDFVTGRYTFDFKLTTYKEGSVGEVGLYKNALTLYVVSAPYLLEYPRSVQKVEVGSPFTTGIPTCPGVSVNTDFVIKSVAPSDGPKVSIDSKNGALTISAPSSDMVGNIYSVSVTVANDLGKANFSNVFTFQIVSEIIPVSTLAYDNIGDVIVGMPFTHKPSIYNGDDVDFSFVDLPKELEKLEIDVYTGKVSCPKGVEITPGTYTVTVLAQNVKSSQTASFTLKIVENPNYFTYVRWGNNLGLVPISEYGNQFRVYHGGIKQSFPILESDIPEGRPVKFEAIKMIDVGGHGLALSAKDGTVEISPGAIGSTVRVHYFQIKVTVGDDETAMTRVFPLFIHQCGYTKDYRIEYTPFAIRVNPKTGGRGPIPSIFDKDGKPANIPTLDMCPHIHWKNLYGPSEHIEGRVSRDATFLRCAWDYYYRALGKLANYGSGDPLSYWNNYKDRQLSITGAYIDAEDLSLVVNPGRFVNDYGYGDGVIDVTVRFALDGKNPTAKDSGSAELWPLFIWLDPTMNE